MNAADRYEWATDADPSRNYCLWDYTRRAPSEDKWRSVNLLFRSFELAGLDARAYDIVDALREAIGPFRTVYGVKLHEGALSWEFYFYDYQRLQREVSMTRVIEALSPWCRCTARPDDALPYFMFSLDIDNALVRGERALDVLHMYVGNPGSTVSSGIAYAVTAASITLENFYFFFDAKQHQAEATAKICSSAYFDPARVALDEVLAPQLRDCDTLCVANKRTHDCVYFSGVDVGQLQFFLARHDYPAGIRDFVTSNAGLLDHLLFDVGTDYRMENGQLRILKTGFYGVF
ncbi:MAG TPA: hypothetical protein VLJ62_21930 [Burkholderiaceae bacterium]|nr:hypothetical protein [Burkholderiaceae bacterium]